MTHRAFSRNAASSRAVPIEKVIQKVIDDPVIPVEWGKNQKGMVAEEQLDLSSAGKAEQEWLMTRDFAVSVAKDMVKLKVHKQVVNRLLEPFSWISVIITATEWENFFSLRCHPAAQPEMQKLAYLIRDAYYESEPQQAKAGYWHLPLSDAGLMPAFPLGAEALTIALVQSVARCARVSTYRDEVQTMYEEDLSRYSGMFVSGHWSPFEHQAFAQSIPSQSGNFVGWTQYRKVLGA